MGVTTGGGAAVAIRVLVADDQPLVRAGIVMLLNAEPGISVIAEAGTGEEAVALAQRHLPDVVLMDVRMPVLDGVSAVRALASDAVTGEADRLVRVLMLTTFDDDTAVRDALRAGASGFLLKHAAPQDLASAIRAVAAGDAWLAPHVTRHVIDELARNPARDEAPGEAIAALTPRERDVLTLMAGGLSNAEIRDRLVVSEATVKTHVARILMKTRSRDRTQAVVLAYRSGLVDPRA